MHICIWCNISHHILHAVLSDSHRYCYRNETSCSGSKPAIAKGLVTREECCQAYGISWGAMGQCEVLNCHELIEDFAENIENSNPEINGEMTIDMSCTLPKKPNFSEPLITQHVAV